MSDFLKKVRLEKMTQSEFTDRETGKTTVTNWLHYYVEQVSRRSGLPEKVVEDLKIHPDVKNPEKVFEVGKDLILKIQETKYDGKSFFKATGVER